MFTKFFNFMKRQQIYHETYYKLNSLSKRELNDIGINRVDIPFLARNVASKYY